MPWHCQNSVERLFFLLMVSSALGLILSTGHAGFIGGGGSLPQRGGDDELATPRQKLHHYTFVRRHDHFPIHLVFPLSYKLEMATPSWIAFVPYSIPFVNCSQGQKVSRACTAQPEEVHTFSPFLLLFGGYTGPSSASWPQYWVNKLTQLRGRY